LEVLKPNTTLSTKELYRAAVKVSVALPEVVVPDPIAPPAGEQRDKKPVPQPSTPDHAIRSVS
jgi:hypothetical protein